MPGFHHIRRVSIRQVNKALRDAGFTGLKLYWGEDRDYLYFSGEQTAWWEETAVWTNDLGYSVDYWVEEARDRCKKTEAERVRYEQSDKLKLR